MIINPPHIIQLLRERRALNAAADQLAALFLHHLGRQTWTEFLTTWCLYLQSIPFDIAREAWGITAISNPATKQP